MVVASEVVLRYSVEVIVVVNVSFTALKIDVDLKVWVEVKIVSVEVVERVKEVVE